jgi:hypothetical protein
MPWKEFSEAYKSLMIVGNGASCREVVRIKDAVCIEAQIQEIIGIEVISNSNVEGIKVMTIGPEGVEENENIGV